MDQLITYRWSGWIQRIARHSRLEYMENTREN